MWPLWPHLSFPPHSGHVKTFRKPVMGTMVIDAEGMGDEHIKSMHLGTCVKSTFKWRIWGFCGVKKGEDTSDRERENNSNINDISTTQPVMSTNHGHGTHATWALTCQALFWVLYTSKSVQSSCQFNEEASILHLTEEETEAQSSASVLPNVIQLGRRWTRIWTQMHRPRVPAVKHYGRLRMCFQVAPCSLGERHSLIIVRVASVQLQCWSGQWAQAVFSSWRNYCVYICVQFSREDCFLKITSLLPAGVLSGSVGLEVGPMSVPWPRDAERDIGWVEGEGPGGPPDWRESMQELSPGETGTSPRSALPENNVGDSRGKLPGCCGSPRTG